MSTWDQFKAAAWIFFSSVVFAIVASVGLVIVIGYTVTEWGYITEKFAPFAAIALMPAAFSVGYILSALLYLANRAAWSNEIAPIVGSIWIGACLGLSIIFALTLPLAGVLQYSASGFWILAAWLDVILVTSVFGAQSVIYFVFRGVPDPKQKYKAMLASASASTASAAASE